MSEVRLLRRPGVTSIAWTELGPADAPALLLCTMATAAMTVWAPVVERLSSERRLILHDRRGEGESDPGPPATHNFETFRDDAMAVLRAAGVERADVCGMAFGARVALRIALDYPERVHRLVLFDATGGPAAPEAERTTGRDEAKRLRDAAGLSTPQVDSAWFHRRDPAGRGLNSRALAGGPAWIDGLQDLAIPTLVACGEQDPNLAGAKRLAAEIPGAVFNAMPMTGHGSILDRPDLVADLLGTFLRR